MKQTFFAIVLACALLMSACNPGNQPAQGSPGADATVQTPEPSPAVTPLPSPPVISPISVDYLSTDEVLAQLDALRVALPEVIALPESADIESNTPGMWEATLPTTKGTIQKADIDKLGKAMVATKQGKLLPFLQEYGLSFEDFSWRFSPDTYGESEYSISSYHHDAVIELLYDTNDRHTLHLLFVREDGDIYRFALLESCYWRYGGSPFIHIWAFDDTLYCQMNLGNSGGTGAYEEIQAIIPLREGEKTALCYYTDWYESYGDISSDIDIQLTDAKLLEDGRIAFQFLAKEDYGVTEFVSNNASMRYSYSLYDDRDGRGLYALCNDAPVKEEIGKRLAILALSEDEDTREIAQSTLFAFSFVVEGYPYLSKPEMKQAVQAILDEVPYTPALGDEKIYLESIGVTPDAVGTLRTSELEAFASALETFHQGKGGASSLSPLLEEWGLQLTGDVLLIENDRENRSFSMNTTTKTPLPVTELYIYQGADEALPQIHLFFIKKDKEDAWTFCAAFQRSFSYFPILTGAGVYSYGLLSMGERLYYQYGDNDQGIILYPLASGEPIHCYKGNSNLERPSIIDFYPMLWPRDEVQTGKPLCSMPVNLDMTGYHGVAFEIAFENDFDGKGFYTYDTNYTRFVRDPLSIPIIQYWADATLAVAMQSGDAFTRKSANFILNGEEE